MNDSLTNQLLELRRGTIVVAILARLQEPTYGYALVKVLEDDGIAVEPGTLYPLLRRLESQGLLTSSWDTTEARPRKYYQISEAGIAAGRELAAEWRDMATKLTKVIQETPAWN